MLEYSAALLFIIPAIYAWIKNNIDYGNGFLFLIITSYIHLRILLLLIFFFGTEKEVHQK